MGHSKTVRPSSRTRNLEYISIENKHQSICQETYQISANVSLPECATVFKNFKTFYPADSYYNGPNGGSTDDPFALDGSTGNDEGMSSTTMLLTLFLILIVTMMYQMSKNSKKNQETQICKPMNTENNDRHFDPPPID